MTVDKLAAMLHGSTYPLRMSRELSDEIKAAGLVVVYGASDDLMEFDGAINEEIGAYEGAIATVDAHGLMPDFNSLLDERAEIEVFRDFFKREGRGRKIEALWDQSDIAWTYKTDIPHETFDIIEDGEVYCRGIVFALSDAEATP
jgi:hypothetical protein